MKVNITKEGGDKLEFEVKDCGVYFANAIRRLAIGQLQIFAIDKVVIYENTSSVFNEFIANRIGLIPIKTPSSGYTEADEIMFSLDVRGPGTIYSKDIKSFDDKVKVSNDKIQLLKLTENQSVRLEAKAKLGIGRKHAKFQAGLAGYEMKDDSFKFKVESFSQIGAREMMVKAAELLEQKCEDFEAGLAEVEKEGRKKKEKED